MRTKATCLILALTAMAACQGGSSGGAQDYTILQDSCEALVAAETGVQPGDVTAASTVSEPTGTLTTVNVVGAAAPWLCRADATGVILGVEFSQEG